MVRKGVEVPALAVGGGQKRLGRNDVRSEKGGEGGSPPPPPPFRPIPCSSLKPWVFGKT